MQLLIGCDRTPSAPAVARRPLSEVRGNNTITGHVYLRGTPPMMETIPNKPCCDGAEPLKEETVIVDPNTGGLKNVLISIDGLPPVSAASIPPLMLDQKNCQYVPHVVGICVGQTMTVRSDDATMHNTHFAPQNNEAKNLVTASPGDSKSTTFTAPEYIRLRCDVHPWMSAYVGVFDTPFFAVSGNDGSFEIHDLPPGRYKLVAWHERYGSLERSIDIPSNATTQPSIEIEYRPS